MDSTNDSNVDTLNRVGQELLAARKNLLTEIANLIRKLKSLVPFDLWDKLPDGYALFQDGSLCNCNAFPAGAKLDEMKRSPTFVLVSVDINSISETHLTAFARLIRDGWLKNVESILSERAALYSIAETEIEVWVKP